MKKIKVGFLPFYIKLYDDSNPHYRDPMVDYSNMMVHMLESQGLEVIKADEVCRIKPEFERAVEKFNREDVAAVITQHLAYSPSLESIDALLTLKAPIIVLDTTVDYDLIRSANIRETYQREPWHSRRTGYVQSAEAQRKALLHLRGPRPSQRSDQRDRGNVPGCSRSEGISERQSRFRRRKLHRYGRLPGIRRALSE